MARTDLTAIAAPGSYATSGTAITWTAADATNGNQFTLTGKQLVLVYNSDTSAHSVTVTSSADEYGRSGDITAESVAAGAYKMFGPFKLPGWVQTDGNLYLSADSATISFAVITLPD